MRTPSFSCTSAVIGNPCVVSNDGRTLRAACLVAASGAVAWFRPGRSSLRCGARTAFAQWLASSQQRKRLRLRH